MVPEFVFTSLILALEFNRIVPDSYMDEIFHIPQLQRFCINDFTYDPKLTTPPALYFISRYMYHTLVPCNDVTLVRSINLLFLFATLAIFQRLTPTPLNLILYPPAFFFYFLYYTDAASSFFVLLAYWLAKKGYFSFSALVTA